MILHLRFVALEVEDVILDRGERTVVGHIEASRALFPLLACFHLLYVDLDPFSGLVISTRCCLDRSCYNLWRIKGYRSGLGPILMEACRRQMDCFVQHFAFGWLRHRLLRRQFILMSTLLC